MEGQNGLFAMLDPVGPAKNFPPEEGQRRVTALEILDPFVSYRSE
jgi:hypothetical protein